MVEKSGRENDFIIESSATSTEEIWGDIGNPVYPPAKAELAKHGLSCDGKRAVLLLKSDYNKYDLFLCMDRNNIRNAVGIFGGDSKNKVKLILNCREISDPWYSRDFEKAYYEIFEGCKMLLKKI